MVVHREQKPGIGAVARWTASESHSGTPALPASPRNPSLAISDLLAGNPADDVDDYIVLRIPRSILNHALAQEYHHMSQTATIPATTPVANAISADPAINAAAADALRAHLADLDRQRTMAAEQIRWLTGDNIAAATQAAQQKGRQNLAKTVGKYSLGVAGIGVLTAAGVYAYRAWKLTRG